MCCENCKCRKKLVDKLVEDCTENIDEVKIASGKSIKINVVLACCTLLFSILFIINIGISAYFIYYKYMNHHNETASKYDYVYQKLFN